MNKILVTGCCGFIGSQMTDFLLKKNFKVIGLDNLSTGNFFLLKTQRIMKTLNFIKSIY